MVGAVINLLLALGSLLVDIITTVQRRCRSAGPPRVPAFPHDFLIRRPGVGATLLDDDPPLHAPFGRRFRHVLHRRHGGAGLQGIDDRLRGTDGRLLWAGMVILGLYVFLGLSWRCCG
jgi:hypothetical protein